ncbi:hypothetical protein KY289_032439 [Solanum tuberosum]|nr:hypothetical protein KY289_032439 [Solanum tuberosum]
MMFVAVELLEICRRRGEQRRRCCLVAVFSAGGCCCCCHGARWSELLSALVLFAGVAVALIAGCCLELLEFTGCSCYWHCWSLVGAAGCSVVLAGEEGIGAATALQGRRGIE